MIGNNVLYRIFAFTMLGQLLTVGCSSSAGVARTPSDITIRCQLVEPDRRSDTEVILAEGRIPFVLTSQKLPEFRREISLTAKNIDARIFFSALAGDISTGLGIGIVLKDLVTGNSSESWSSTQEVEHAVSGRLSLRRPYFLSERARLIENTPQGIREFAVDCLMEPE